MTNVSSESDPRRAQLLKQLAAILQTDDGGDQAAAPSVKCAPDRSLAELFRLGFPAPQAAQAGQGNQRASGPILDATPPAAECAGGHDAVVAAIIGTPPGGPPQTADAAANEYLPIAPSDFSGYRLAESEVESLALKFLLYRTRGSGREIARQIGMPFRICEKLLQSLKTDRLVVLKGASELGDYLYELTDAGLQRARKFAEHCQYSGTAPVCLDDYAASVAAQSLKNSLPKLADLRRAFADLTLSEETFERLGRAMMSGKGLFLYGPPGNGKTSIAQRVTRAFGEHIWVPRAIGAWGEIVRVFDPSCHQEAPLPKGAGLTEDDTIDRRWVRIRRPTIIVGGELILENLEITANAATGIAEAPLQLKSNCGTLVIDDFGRQRVAPAALLNRWIVPLEKRYDFLNLTSGRKIRVPFDQFIVFSTNLQPRDLVDEAFLRRIPYKIDVCGPTEVQFRELFLQVAKSMGIEPVAPPLEHLIETYYRSTGRALRFCHPRDLLRQVKVYCEILDQPAKLSLDAIDAAAADYFSVL